MIICLPLRLFCRRGTLGFIYVQAIEGLCNVTVCCHSGTDYQRRDRYIVFIIRKCHEIISVVHIDNRLLLLMCEPVGCTTLIRFTIRPE